MGLKAVATSGGGGGTVPSFSDAEVPAGTIDNVNAVFTLGHSPNPAGSLLLVLNGVTQTAGGVDYTLAANVITYSVAPPAGSQHEAWYRY